MPVCVLASAGTVNSGALADMQQMADVCDSTTYGCMSTAFGAPPLFL